MSYVENEITIALQQSPITADKLADKTILLLSIIATNSEVVDSGYTVIIIDIAPADPAPPAPVFERSIYRGNLDDNLQLTLEQLALTQATYTDDVEFELRETGIQQRIKIGNILGLKLILSS